MEQRELLRKFGERYGDAEGTKVYFAPGRVNLIGEHIDYNGGYVMPCALTMGTYGVARKRDDRMCRFYSLNIGGDVVEISLEEIKPTEENDWTNYIKGVMAAFAERGFSMPRGFDLLLYGNIPSGAGLSSSASVEVLIGFILRDLYGFDVSNVDLALIGQQAEHEFCGVNCGIMDQFAVAMGKEGHAIYLNTENLSYEYVPVKMDGVKIVLASSNKKHSLADSAYNDRRRECEEALQALQKKLAIQELCQLDKQTFDANSDGIQDEVCYRRARHAVYENERTKKAVELLRDNELMEFGMLLNESHRSLSADYEVTGKEMDALAAAAWKQNGVLGSRITGGGFGGCTVSLVEEQWIDNFVEQVGKEYTDKTGLKADFYVVEIGGGPVVYC
ncbi:MAG: galactokinase [Eubacterium sp.]|nr:galactokinase [Eubacterium sp.]